MTNETESTPKVDEKPIPFGMRLKQEREKLGIDRKEVGIQLRLPEKIIIMMEKERYSADLPVTFIRGYIKAYGKFLQIPEFEINKALDIIKPNTTPANIIPFSSRSLVPMNKKRDYMQISSYLILFSLTGLLSFWWYNHYAKNPTSLIEKATVLLENKKPLVEKMGTSLKNNIKESQTLNTSLAVIDNTKKNIIDDDPYIDDI